MTPFNGRWAPALAAVASAIIAAGVSWAIASNTAARATTVASAEEVVNLRVKVAQLEVLVSRCILKPEVP